MSEPLDLLLEVVALKRLPRSGWVRHGVDRPESVAGHSWGVSWLVLALLPAHLDRARALTYATLHDLAEVRVGDLTPHDGVSADDKAAREAAAIEEMLATWRPDLVETWHAYERQADEEARFVRQLDRLDMVLQAVSYAREGHPGLLEFIDSARRVIVHPTLRALVDKAERALAQADARHGHP